MKRYLLIGFFVALINCFGAVRVFGVDVTLSGNTELSTLLEKISNGGTLVVTTKGYTVTVSGSVSVKFDQVVEIDGLLSIDGNNRELVINGKLSASKTNIDNKAKVTVNEGAMASLGLVAFNNNSVLVANGDVLLTSLTMSTGSATVNVGTNGTFKVEEDFNVDNGKATFNGEIIVEGNINFKNSIKLSGSGVLEYGTISCPDGKDDDCLNWLHSHGFGSGTARPLPIVLTSFTAVSKPEGTNIYWTTESEQDNDYFTIYRSADGENFEPIATVEGAGNSTMTLNYSFTDYDPIVGVSYYLLKQTDYDGECAYSEKIAVNRRADIAEVSFRVYPNPNSGNDLTIDLGAIQSTNVDIAIYSATGVLEYSFSDKPSGVKLVANPELPAGVHFIVVKSQDMVATQQLIVE